MEGKEWVRYVVGLEILGLPGLVVRLRFKPKFCLPLLQGCAVSCNLLSPSLWVALQSNARSLSAPIIWRLLLWGVL